MTLLNPDMVVEIKDELDADATLTAIEGWDLRTNISRQVLASTTKPGNKVSVINQKRCGPEEPTCGGLYATQHQYVSIETIVRCLENDTNDARVLAQEIVTRIIQVMQTAAFNGTGWKSHRKEVDRYVGNFTKTLAFHELVYDCFVTVGTE